MAFEHEVWATGDDVATGGLKTPPELEDDFVKSTTGIAGLGVRTGVLDLITLGAIARNFPCLGTVGDASLVVAANFFCCACAFGTRNLSEYDEEESFLCLFSLFPKSGLLNP